MGKKNEIKVEGLPTFTEHDLYFVRKLISHVIPDATDLINKSGWSEACKSGIERIDSLNRHYFFNAFNPKSLGQDLTYPEFDDDTEF